MSLCCLCNCAIQGILNDYAPINGRKRELVKCLLKLAGLPLGRKCTGIAEIACRKCENDLEYVEKILSNLRQEDANSHRQITPADHVEHAESYNTASEMIQCSSSTKSSSRSCHIEISHESLPRKRVRRPPKRYRDEETPGGDEYKKFVKNIEISTYQNKIQSSSLSSYPKMAHLRTSEGTTIGTLVEVPRRGKHSRLRIICGECTEAFNQERQFRQHLSIHMKRKANQTLFHGTETHPPIKAINFTYFCTLCEKGFQEHFAVRRHFKTTHNEDRQFQCEMCPASFKYKTNLDYHNAKHLNNRNYQCPMCQKKFVLRYELQVHLRIHTGEKPFRCQICSMAFAHRSNLQKHRQAHREQVNKAIKCHKCKNSFKTAICLKRHYERMHMSSNHQGIVSHKFIEDSQNPLDKYEFSKNMDNYFISVKGVENTNTFEKLPKISLNFIPESIDVPIEIGAETTETMIANNSLNAPVVAELSNNLNYTHLPHTIVDLENSSTSHSSILPKTIVALENNYISHSSILPTTADGQFVPITPNAEHVNDTISFNTSTEDFVQTCHNSNIQWTNQTTNTSINKPINTAFINILPKNMKIVKFSKTNNSKLQDFYAKSKCEDATTTLSVENNKQGNAVDDSINKFLTNSTNNGLSIIDNNYKLNDLASSKIVDQLQIQNGNGLPLIHNKHIFVESAKVISNDKINRNYVSKDVQINADFNNTMTKKQSTWYHYQNSPLTCSILKSPEITNSKIANVDASDTMMYKQCKKLKTAINLKENNSNQICDNREKPQKSTQSNENTSFKINKSLAKNFADPSYSRTLTVVPDSSNRTVTKSPYSLLKSQMPIRHARTLKTVASPKSKPLITNVEILPHINLQEIVSPLQANEVPIQSSSSSYVVTIPAEYKFQCSKCWKYFKQKSALTKHLRTHTGEMPYKCNVCPKSYADASNYKKHKMLHIKAADALNIARPKPPPSPALSNVTDPDPDGIEVMQTIQPFQLSSGDSDDDDVESYLWQDALQHSLMNKEIRENIRRNLRAINSAIMPAAESVNVAGNLRTHLFSPNCFSSKNRD